MPSNPTLTARLDLCVKCGVPMETLKRAGFLLNEPVVLHWEWLGYSLEGDIFIRGNRITTATLALDAVCVEWLGDNGYDLRRRKPKKLGWAVVRRKDRHRWNAPTLTAAIHAAMLAVAKGA